MVKVLMKTVQSLTSRNYHDFLIESLCDSEEMASYIETVLEEGNREPELLLQVLSNVMEAHKKMNNFSDLAMIKYEQLQTIFNDTQGGEIYTFLELLAELNLSILIKVKNN